MKATITILPGDGIGVEIMREAVTILVSIAQTFGHDFTLQTNLIGGAAYDQTGSPLPDETLQACLASDAVLLGAIGAPQYSTLPLELKPESGWLKLRAALGVYANIRPAFLHDPLLGASPLRPEVVRGMDLIVVRELLGGLMFGEPRELTATCGLNTLAYTAPEVERIARVAFDLARHRRRKVTSIDKANVLESSQLWRNIVTEVARAYPDVQLEHNYVDNCAMALVTKPTAFDVIVTENLFGDILSDEASALTGALATLPSACFGDGVALYETVQGSQANITGKNIANPLGAIACVAMMLRHSLQLGEEAQLLETAICTAIANGYGTPDLPCQPHQTGTAEISARIRRYWEQV